VARHAGALLGAGAVRRISRIRDSEVRRAAIEYLGWPEFIRQARLRLRSAAPDPGNPGRELRLYDLPRRFGPTRRRLLVMVNGSPDSDGRDRVYAETVPAELHDAIAAAAWQYDVPVETYRQVERRT
jgi:hypothetical protein